MYKKDLAKLDIDDLETIKDNLRVLETFLFNMQSIDKDLKSKRKGFNPKTRRELRTMFVFWRLSSFNIKHTLWSKKGKRGREPKKYTGRF